LTLDRERLVCYYYAYRLFAEGAGEPPGMNHSVARTGLIAVAVAVVVVTACGCVRSKPERAAVSGIDRAQPSTLEPSPTMLLALPVVGGVSEPQVSGQATATPTLAAAATVAEPILTTAPPESAALVAPAPSTPGDIPYTVRDGDTLFSIAEHFGCSTQAILLRNGLSDSAVIRSGQMLLIPVGYEPSGTPIPTVVRHTVQAGETLSSIARTYQTTASAIMAENPTIKDAESLPVGTVLTVTLGTAPAMRTHRVKAGETLSEIAAQYGLTTNELAKANALTNPNMVRAGQTLIIPW